MESILRGFDYRKELVDDKIEHQIQRIGGSGTDAIGAVLQALADTLIATAAAVPDGGNVISADKQMGFAKFHACFPKLGGARGNEHMPFVFLQLGALVGRNRVFQCQCVQAEFVTQPLNGLAVRGTQLDPDEAICQADMIADVVKGDGLDFRIVEQKAVDDGTRLKYRIQSLILDCIAKYLSHAKRAAILA